jgi:serine/threonine protein kinase
VTVDLASPPLAVGRYLLYGPLASGGMATVHLGRLIGPGGFSRMVAIKRLHQHFATNPEFVSGLLDEARLSARIWHPNVVPTLDIVAKDEHLLLVMEYVQGESLARLIEEAHKRKESVPLRVAIGIVAAALHGLHAAHEACGENGQPLHIVHRDMSPQNIIVGVDGVPRVLDFGVAKAVGRLQHTETGQLKGKLSYMAPEQFRSQPVDRRTDVFAGAIVLWELLTSRRLFAAENEASTLQNLLHGSIDAPSQHAPELPTGLDEIVMRGLSRDPNARYGTAREMALALEQLVQPATGSQIGSWVMGLAEGPLAHRARRVREIESTTADTRAPEGDTSASRSGAHNAVLGPTRIHPADQTAVAAMIPTSVSKITQGSPVADAVARRLAAYLGPHTSKVAVKTFAVKALGRGPETLTAADIPTLQTALRPMLRTFIGRTQCEKVLEDLGREFGT